MVKRLCDFKQGVIKMTIQDSAVRNLIKVAWLLSKERKVQFTLLIALSLFTAIIESVVISLVIPFTEGITQQGNGLCSANSFSLSRIITFIKPDFCELSTITIFLIAGSTLSCLLKIYYTYISGRYVSLAGGEISKRSYIKQFSTSYEELTSRNVEEDVNGLVIHLNNCLVALTYLVRLISSLILGSVIIIMLWIISPIATILSMTIFAGIYMGVSIQNRSKIARSSRLIEDYNEQQIEEIQNIHDSPRNFILESNIRQKSLNFSQLEYNKRSEWLYIDLLGSIPRSLLESVALTFFVAITYIGSTLSGGNTIQFMPYAAAFLLASQRLIPSMQQTYMNWLGIRSFIQSINYVYKCIRSKEVVSKTLIDTRKVNQIGSVGLEFSYSGGTKHIFKDIDLVFKKGTITCITGRSGYGKSTLIDLLIGLREPSRGYVYLKTSEPDETKQILPLELIDTSLCEQGAVLNKGSLIENLSGNPQANSSTNKNAEKIAKELGLGKYIEDGIDDIRKQMSGGEIQRVCVGRALIKPSNVVILDEPTSALDDNSCKKVIDCIKSHSTDRIIIITSHDKRLIDSCDTIIDLESLNS